MTDVIKYRWRYGDESGYDITDINHYAEQDAVSATAWSGEDYVVALKRSAPGRKWMADSVGHPVPLSFYNKRFGNPDEAITELARGNGVTYEEGDEL